jgi:hypothetical protein
MSTGNLSVGNGQPARKANNLTAICEPIVQKMWEPRRLTTLGAYAACYGDSFIFFKLTVRVIYIYAVVTVTENIDDNKAQPSVLVPSVA